MKKKIITYIKCIGLFLIFSFIIEFAVSLFSGLLNVACMCYDVEFQQKIIEFIGYIIADLIGVVLSLKIVGRKSDLSNNKLILPFYLIVIFLTHPALGNLSYFNLCVKLVFVEMPFHLSSKKGGDKERPTRKLLVVKRAVMLNRLLVVIKIARYENVARYKIILHSSWDIRW